MEMSFFKQELAMWSLVLALGLPLLILILGELSERLKRRDNPLAQGLRQIRVVVLPVLTLWIIMRYIFDVDSDNNWSRTVETLLWMVAAYIGLTLVRNLTQFGGQQPEMWVNQMPALVFALVRAVMIFFVVSTILSGIWGFDVGKLTTAVGLGSMAIAFALQDTLSNLVSGFLLLADRPFKVGDFLNIGGQWLVVKEIGWRTTRFSSYDDNAEVVLPNGDLGKQKLTYYGQEGSIIVWRFYFTFSYDDPPNLVKQALTEVAQNLDHLEPGYALEVWLYGYEDYGIRYRVSVWFDFWNIGYVWDDIKVRTYYAAKRYGLTLARPIGFRGNVDDLKPILAPPHIAGILRANALFAPLESEAIDKLVTGTTVRDYAAGEPIVHQGEPDEGFYVISTGEVSISVRNGFGTPQEIVHLKPGDFFGEMALLRNEPSPVSAIATTDVYLLLIRGPLITELIETNPHFAQEVNLFIEKRQTLVQAISEPTNGKQPHTARQDWIDVAKRV